MKTAFNKKSERTEWTLNRWYEKAIFVYGIINTTFLAFYLFIILIMALAVIGEGDF